LLRRGHEVHLITPRTGGPVPEELHGVHVHELDRPAGTDPAEREVRAQRSDAQAAPVLADLHRTQPLDLVYERYSLWGAATAEWTTSQEVPHLLKVNAPLVDEQAQHRTLIDRTGAEQVA